MRPSDPDAGETPPGTVEISLAHGIAAVPAEEWDACAAPETADGGRALNPFLTHRFLLALEESGSVGEEAGWLPHHLIARSGGEIAGVMPLYLKGHSQGEYVFDYGWADAYERAGGRYYPKFQCAVPFTPVTGRRFLTREGGPLPEAAARAALMQGAAQVTEGAGVSSLHVTFCTEGEWRAGGEMGYLQRTDQQYHFANRGYADFDAFLGELASRKRKQLRKERAEAVANGIRLHWFSGAELKPEHWAAMWRFYQDTGSRKWGYPYLTRSFFDIAAERLADDILLILAERDGRWVAGAMNVIGRETLFGRYWGCIEHHPCLHFETCYYQAIDYALAHGLKSVEAGAQGGHKIARGYEPVTTHSIHWIADPGLRDAIDRYLVSERRSVARQVEALRDHTPFRKGGGAG